MKRPYRVVVAKPGLDGHDRGAKTITRALRDHGFEVIYTGLHQTPEQIAGELAHVDGAMLGRRAYHHPWELARWDTTFFGEPHDPATDHESVEEAMVAYMVREHAARAPIVRAKNGKGSRHGSDKTVVFGGVAKHFKSGGRGGFVALV